ncbi:Tetratricopeptide (TPR) repeat [Bryocella elongata]|uniref:Tetratricopeptide (TPR) repeat n=1 Tax=Bryocella elongata TaxID=863522 RepID=A0A1H6AWZ8_9BACT|nr:tetratricopeptide repeat protein [Bryocella elongata]SEG52316.1 Tetratricopeptide (TPR) repeat [Bryocella elongata]
MQHSTKLRILVTGMALAAAIAVVPSRAAAQDQAAAEARAQYNTKQSAIYNYKFGNDHPYLPSNATTDTGAFIDPKNFPTAQYCGHCHQEAHAEWRQSVHSNSNRVPYYLRNVNLLAAEKGIASTRHCEGCHDPIALVSGSLTDKAPRTRPYDQDGVTCMVCHSIQSVNTRGTGSYVMGTPAVLVDEAGKPITHAVSDADILAHLDRHSAAVMKPLYKTSEFCSACHKAALPKTLNDYKWLRAISLYDEWQNASFSKESPLPFYRKDVVSTCQTCHMKRADLGTLPDYGAKNHQLASHRWAAANMLIPQIYKYNDQADAVVKFLKDQVVNVDIFAVEPETPAEGQPELIAPLGKNAFNLNAGQRVLVDVVIQNKGTAHSLVPEQRDMYEMYVDFTVKDATGKILYENGALQPDNELDPEAHSFTNRLINAQGGINALHQVWDNRVVAYNNTIQSGRSQLIRYAFTMPKAGGPVSVTATVRYRRFDQHFINFGMSMPMGQNYSQPVIDMTTTTRTLNTGANAPTAAQANENPEWMRWNNYGIGLLDAQQYAASLAAFQQVAKLRSDYADAYTNQAIVCIGWEKYDDGLPYLNKALSLLKDDSRALYYLALVERNQGDLEDSVKHLQMVEAKFPRSRDAHRELGFSFYQMHQYDKAMAEYLQVQAIDPDDLAAHYNLAILYRRTGQKEKASVEAAYFADQKDDPTASTFALEYLRKHREIANESVPWHVHDLDHHETGAGQPVAPAAQVGSLSGVVAGHGVMQ